MAYKVKNVCNLALYRKSLLSTGVKQNNRNVVMDLSHREKQEPQAGSYNPVVGVWTTAGP